MTVGRLVMLLIVLRLVAVVTETQSYIGAIVCRGMRYLSL